MIYVIKSDSNEQKEIHFCTACQLTFAGSAEAQIFNTNNESKDARTLTGHFEWGGQNANTRDGEGGNEELGNEDIPTPIGSGVFLLSGMAGAYAIMRHRKETDK